MWSMALLVEREGWDWTSRPFACWSAELDDGRHAYDDAHIVAAGHPSLEPRVVRLHMAYGARGWIVARPTQHEPEGILYLLRRERCSLAANSSTTLVSKHVGDGLILAVVMEPGQSVVYRTGRTAHEVSCVLGAAGPRLARLALPSVDAAGAPAQPA